MRKYNRDRSFISFINQDLPHSDYFSTSKMKEARLTEVFMPKDVTRQMSANFTPPP